MTGSEGRGRRCRAWRRRLDRPGESVSRRKLGRTSTERRRRTCSEERHFEIQITTLCIVHVQRNPICKNAAG